jgi:hypothetical protein
LYRAPALPTQQTVANHYDTAGLVTVLRYSKSTDWSISYFFTM